jgi:RsiW-degrading membrane proteinase PrsW (M82 family)
MARINLKIPWRYRGLLFGFIALSWLTGVTFFVMNRWITVEGEFGPEKHPAQAIFLKVHGAAAFTMMVSYGYLLATHVPAGLRSRRQRMIGLTLVAAQGFMILTAYGLYYISGEQFREWVSYAHASVGFVFPALLAWHILSGIRERMRR